MRIQRSRRRLATAALASLALWAAPPVLAQGYPAQPVKVIIPYAAGGGADAVARIAAAGLQKELGQNFLIESRSGANTTLAAQAVARAPADGYTLLMTGGTTMAIQPLITEKPTYSPFDDFAPVGMLSRTPYLLAVSVDLGVGSVAELIAAARERPGQLAYASNGIGGSVHLGMEMLATQAGVSFNHVPYRGFAPAIPDLLTGRTPVILIDQGALGTHADGGRVRILATTSRERFELFPDVPTLAELGFPGYEIETWFALYAPARTPPEIVRTLNAALRRVLEGEAARKALTDLGNLPSPSTPQQVTQRIRQEQRSYLPLVQAAGLVARPAP